MFASSHAKSLQLHLTLCNTIDYSLWLLCPWDSPGQEHWSGLPCLPTGALPDPEIEPASLTHAALAGGFFTTSTTYGSIIHKSQYRDDDDVILFYKYIYIYIYMNISQPQNE